MDQQPRIRVCGEQQVRIALVVAQQDVVARPEALDQRVFEQQRLGFRVRDRDLDAGDLRDQRAGLGRVDGLAEVARHAALQVARLADVQHLTLDIEHAVDAGQRGQRAQEGAGIERSGGGGLGHGVRAFYTELWQIVTNVS